MAKSNYMTTTTKQNCPQLLVQLCTQGGEKMERQDFANRLTELRSQSGVSARDMSLSIGQSAGYINNIENGINLPSMTSFFFICEYLGISPKEFFDMEEENPLKLRELIESCNGLTDTQLDHVIAIVKDIRR